MSQNMWALFVWTAVLAGAALVSAVVHLRVRSSKRAHKVAAIAFTLIIFVGDVAIRRVLDGWWFALGPIFFVICYVTSNATGAVMDQLGWSARTRGPDRQGTD